MFIILIIGFDFDQDLFDDSVLIYFLFCVDSSKGETMLCYLFNCSIVNLVSATSEHVFRSMKRLRCFDFLFVFLGGTSRVPVLLVATTEDCTKAIFR